jgi:outer membrane lipoprotein carrier protein
MLAAVVFWLSAAAVAPQQQVSEIVRGVERRYQSAQTLRAVFLERYAEDRNSIRIESGTVYFARGGRMRWEYEAPEEKLFLSDGKTVWFYVPADRTVTRAKLKETAGWQSPLAFLVGQAKFSRFCSRIELADERLSPEGQWMLRCLPKSKDSGFSEARMEIDAQFRILRVLVREPAGVETEFRFGDWQENLPVSAALFRFTAPPGVAIVDSPDAP